LPALSGVPQGSILGPQLFLICINDLPSAIHSSNMFSFADDTKCFMKIVSEMDIHIFQEDLSSVSEWSNKNNLAFSIPKFVFLHYHNKFNFVYSNNGDIITCSDSYMDLDIYFSHGDCTFRTLPLNPTNHLDYFGVYSKMSILSESQKEFVCAYDQIYTTVLFFLFMEAIY